MRHAAQHRHCVFLENSEVHCVAIELPSKERDLLNRTINRNVLGWSSFWNEMGFQDTECRLIFGKCSDTTMSAAKVGLQLDT